MLRIRCSSLGLIMTQPVSVDDQFITDELKIVIAKKNKDDAEKDLIKYWKDRSLSVGAKTYLKSLAKEFVYGFEENATSKYMEKGLLVEDESIALYNRVFRTNYAKNKERKTNDWITGECDIDTGIKIIDAKSCWSLATFPCLKEDAYDKDYEWQLRGYMMLWEREQSEVSYMMVSTPDELIRYEQIDLHYVDAIDENLRVTKLEYTRDLELEEQIKIKCNAAQEYFNSIVDQIANEHNYS